MIFFIEVINSLCKQDKENKIEDNHQQSRMDTHKQNQKQNKIKRAKKRAAEPNQNQLERNKMYLASASLDKTIKVWDLDTFQCLKTLQGHAGPVCSIQFLGKGLIASSGKGLVLGIDYENRFNFLIID